MTLPSHTGHLLTRTNLLGNLQSEIILIKITVRQVTNVSFGHSAKFAQVIAIKLIAKYEVSQPGYLARIRQQ